MHNIFQIKEQLITIIETKLKISSLILSVVKVDGLVGRNFDVEFVLFVFKENY